MKFLPKRVYGFPHLNAAAVPAGTTQSKGKEEGKMATEKLQNFITGCTFQIHAHGLNWFSIWL